LPTTPPANDSAEFTPQASLAATAQQALTAIGDESAIREAQVEAAKERIEAGTYRLQEVVLQVASRISRFVE
jgi:anti-sigma28 factor (negative regulator of flagellin synthesis)